VSTFGPIGPVGFMVQGSWFKVQGTGFRVEVQGSGFRVQGSRFRDVQGLSLEFRVQGCGGSKFQM